MSFVEKTRQIFIFVGVQTDMLQNGAWSFHSVEPLNIPLMLGKRTTGGLSLSIFKILSLLEQLIFGFVFGFLAESVEFA